MSVAVMLHGVDATRPVAAVKALRSATGASLRYAKMDVYDRVRDGHAVVVSVLGEDLVEDLRLDGWEASLAEGANVSFAAQVPVEHVEALRHIVRALGGTS